MANFSNREKAIEAEREVKMRKQVYPRMGKNSPTDKTRIAIMAEIAQDYRKLAQGEQLFTAPTSSSSANTDPTTSS